MVWPNIKKSLDKRYFDNKEDAEAFEKDGKVKASSKNSVDSKKTLPKIGSFVTLGKKEKQSTWTSKLKSGKKVKVLFHDKLDGKPVVGIATEDEYNKDDFDPEQDYHIVYVSELK